MQAEDGIADLGHSGIGLHRPHGSSGHDGSGASRAHGLHCGTHRGSGGEAVVDQKDCFAGELVPDPGVRFRPAEEFGPLAGLHLVQPLLAPAVLKDPGNQWTVEQAHYAPLGPCQGSVRCFIVARNAELPHEDSPKGEIQGFGSCSRNRDAATGQPQHDGIWAFPELR
ncbi:MAG: hypothetical protein NVSMB43_16470 [Pseudarthrobacter sp.]